MKNMLWCGHEFESYLQPFWPTYILEY